MNGRNRQAKRAWSLPFLQIATWWLGITLGACNSAQEPETGQRDAGASLVDAGPAVGADGSVDAASPDAGATSGDEELDEATSSDAADASLEASSSPGDASPADSTNDAEDTSPGAPSSDAGDAALPSLPVVPTDAGGVMTTVSAAGGRACLPGGICLTFPAGAVSGPLDVSLTALARPAPIHGFSAFGPVYSLEPNGQSFLAPVTLALPVPSNELPGDASASSLQVLWANEGSSDYASLPSVLTGGTLSAQTTHFSDYTVGLAGVDSTSPSCPAETPLLCGPVCVNPATDQDDCGQCGDACGSGQTCASGSCVCQEAGTTNSNGVCCAAGTGNCSHHGACDTDLTSDPQHCGACGNACDSSLTCISGQCVAPATPSYQIAISGDGYETPMPSGDITVLSGAPQSFTVTFADGYVAGPVTGTCPSIPSAWTGNVYTTGPITASCTVIFSGVPATCVQEPGLCDPHATCNAGSCACANGYAGAGTPGTCKAMLGSPCATSADCVSGLGCGTDHVCGGAGAACTAANGGHASSQCVHDYCPASQCTAYDDPCAANNGGCDANAACADHAGSAQCTCNAGYVGDGTSCAVFVNACAATPNPCGAGGMCQMLPNSNDYQCTCSTGYTLASNTCRLDYAADVDVCDATNPSGSFTSLFGPSHIDVIRTLTTGGTLVAAAFSFYKYSDDYAGTVTLSVYRQDGSDWDLLGSPSDIDVAALGVEQQALAVDCAAPAAVFDLSAQPIVVNASDVIKLTLTPAATSDLPSGQENFGLGTLAGGEYFIDDTLTVGVTPSDAIYVLP